MDIKVHDISVDLSGHNILGGLSFGIPEGASVAIVGMSGAGKSTLLRVLAGLCAPSRGSVRIGGRAPAELHASRTISLLFQTPALMRHLSVEEALTLTSQIHGRPVDPAQIQRVLAEVGLGNAAALFPHQLSVGMKARLALARVLAVPPAVLLLDEPFAAVDPIRREELNNHVQALRPRHGCTIAWVTHDIVEALRFSTHIVALAGRPARIAKILDIADLGPIPDSASLPVRALAYRDELLRAITEEPS